MDLNGNGITVSNDVWNKMKPHVPKDPEGKPVHPITAEALALVIEEYRKSGKSFKMGMVFPVSTHNYEIRYWLGAAGINPGFYTNSNIQGQIDAEVLLSVTPPRGEPQDVLLEIWQKEQITTVAITHDVDESIFLADRVIMMTSGPHARIGDELIIPFERPRNRRYVLDHPEYYDYRGFLLDFLNH